MIFDGAVPRDPYGKNPIHEEIKKNDADEDKKDQENWFDPAFFSSSENSTGKQGRAYMRTIFFPQARA